MAFVKILCWVLIFLIRLRLSPDQSIGEGMFPLELVTEVNPDQVGAWSFSSLWSDLSGRAMLPPSKESLGYTTGWNYETCLWQNMSRTTTSMPKREFVMTSETLCQYAPCGFTFIIFHVSVSH